MGVTLGGFQDAGIPLYLDAATTPQMIEDGAKSGILRAIKYYPPHGTTGAEYGADFIHYLQNGVFEAAQDHGVTLCIHGEEHGKGEAYFDENTNAEDVFYKEQMRLIDAYPDLRVVGEHLTTKTAVDFIAQARIR